MQDAKPAWVCFIDGPLEGQAMRLSGTPERIRLNAQMEPINQFVWPGEKARPAARLETTYHRWVGFVGRQTRMTWSRAESIMYSTVPARPDFNLIDKKILRGATTFTHGMAEKPDFLTEFDQWWSWQCYRHGASQLAWVRQERLAADACWYELHRMFLKMLIPPLPSYC